MARLDFLRKKDTLDADWLLQLAELSRLHRERSDRPIAVLELSAQDIRPPNSALESRVMQALGVDVRASLDASQVTSDLVRGRQLVRDVLRVIGQRAHEPRLRLGDVADTLSVSEWRVSVCLKRVTGFGFPSHLHRERIAKAKEYLADSTDSVGEIARRLGYERRSDFARHFRRFAGTTPTIWRSRLARLSRAVDA
jgi:AraC-like DNA-binding protein